MLHNLVYNLARSREATARVAVISHGAFNRIQLGWRWRRDTSAAPRSDKWIPSRPPSCKRSWHPTNILDPVTETINNRTEPWIIQRMRRHDATLCVLLCFCWIRTTKLAPPRVRSSMSRLYDVFHLFWEVLRKRKEKKKKVGLFPKNLLDFFYQKLVGLFWKRWTFSQKTFGAPWVGCMTFSTYSEKSSENGRRRRKNWIFSQKLFLKGKKRFLNGFWGKSWRISTNLHTRFV